MILDSGSAPNDGFPSSRHDHRGAEDNQNDLFIYQLELMKQDHLLAHKRLYPGRHPEVASAIPTRGGLVDAKVSCRHCHPRNLSLKLSSTLKRSHGIATPEDITGKNFEEYELGRRFPQKTVKARRQPLKIGSTSRFRILKIQKNVTVFCHSEGAPPSKSLAVSKVTQCFWLQEAVCTFDIRARHSCGVTTSRVYKSR